MKRILAATLLFLAPAVGGCERPTSPPSAVAPGEAQLGKRAATSSQVPYTIQFSGDIESAPIAVTASATNPLYNLSSPVTPIVLPDLPDLAGCGIDGGNWSPYAGSWSGQLALTGDGTTATMNFVAYSPTGIPFWLSVKGAATTTTVGTTTVLTFSNVSAMAKMDQYPLVVIFPCTSFSIPATRV